MTDKQYSLKVQQRNAERLARAYKELAVLAIGVSVTDMAKKLRISPRTVQRWFRSDSAVIRNLFRDFRLIDNRVFSLEHAIEYYNHKISIDLGKNARVIFGD